MPLLIKFLAQLLLRSDRVRAGLIVGLVLVVALPLVAMMNMVMTLVTVLSATSAREAACVPAARGVNDAAGAVGGQVDPGSIDPDKAREQYKLGAVKDHVAIAAGIIGQKFDVKTIGGYRADATDMEGHPAGLALDVMTMGDKKKGKQIADWTRQNSAALGVLYVNWDQQIWNSLRDAEGWRMMEDRGSPTANHEDHVHLSFVAAAPSMPPKVSDAGAVQQQMKAEPRREVRGRGNGASIRDGRARDQYGPGDKVPGKAEPPPDVPNNLPVVDGYTENQVAHAWAIRQVALDVQAGDQGAIIAIAVAETESQLGDDPSTNSPDENNDAGVFQQRTLIGWHGPKATQEENVRYLANTYNAAQTFFQGWTVTREKAAFAERAGVEPGGPVGYHENGLLDDPDWKSRSLVDAAHKVQRSAYPERVGKKEAGARRLVAALAKQTPGSVAGRAQGENCGSGQGRGQRQGDAVGGSNLEGVGKAAIPMKEGEYRIGAYFGKTGSWARYHTGQDFPAPVGTAVYAAAAGKVEEPQAGSWAGTHVIIRHQDGSATLYAHLSAATVQPGAEVKAGQNIGKVGTTGRSFGPHLHFEHYPKGAGLGSPYEADDPMKWLAGLGVKP